MDQSKPLSYQCLKCVVQNLDVNKRFFIASHLPSLRKIHKVVPLKIDTLKLGKSNFVLDGMKYSFTTIIEKDSDKEDTPIPCKTWTDSTDGVPYDVNQFGEEEMDHVLLSGDILIEERRELHVEILENRRRLFEQEEQLRQANENMLRRLEVDQQRLKKNQPKIEKFGKTLSKEISLIEEVQKLTESIHQQTIQQLALEKNQEARQKFEVEIEQLQNKLDKYQKTIEDNQRDITMHHQLQEFTRREIEDNQLIIDKIRQDLEPLKTYIQYTLTNNKTELQRSLRFPREIKIRDASKQQFQHVLGGRRCIQVNRFEIDISTGVLRLPEGMKIKVKDLSIRDNADSVIEAIKQILDVSCFPLERLSVEVPRDPLFQNEILRSAKSLDIKIQRNVGGGAWSDVLINLPNPKIHLSGKEIPKESILAIARHWIENSRSVGSKFAMTSRLVSDYLDYLVLEIPGGRKNYSRRIYDEFPYCVTMQISETSELMIYGFETPNHREELAKDDGQPWILVMEVMNIESAKPN